MFVLFALTVAVGDNARADFIDPPWGADPHPPATRQQWSFDTNVDHGAPDSGHNNVYGDPYFDGSGTWQNAHHGRNGIRVLNGDDSDVLRFKIPNLEDVERLKRVFVQVIFKEEPRAGLPDAAVITVGVPLDGPFEGFTEASSTLRLLENGWYHLTSEWTRPGCPAFEVVDISAPAGATLYVDAARVDTTCVPEPAAFALLAAGGLSLARRRRTR